MIEDSKEERYMSITQRTTKKKIKCQSIVKKHKFCYKIH